MIAQVTSRTYTPEEYLALEIASETRNEYINGAIIPMPGGMPNHNLIILNLASILHFALKTQGYQVFVTDQRLWIPDYKIYTYPDIMVISGNFMLQEGRKDTITNPVMVVEVLSESTANYDRGQKFQFYRSIPSLQEYLLVDQYSYSVQHYSKLNERKWEFQEYISPTEVIEFTAINSNLAVTDIYDRVEFEVNENGS
ncbi:Uncharacterized protein conserved in cyanobacteria [Gloeomargarita lithophora Alchichica-D10]|uniref:Uncharacterized protein conserved in cyanobacteria n=1 Tax=Gloeomargarita lithophora Alchichica-D10 TaxID=1188229 RepID=A0A1J0ACN4_9CYAN|nr:Uma2 family endonuclease [Gloeomargarita lithophora]APB33679.1 Uncharacterized protein conserved in cyanobacteria [Gloeomargarita lithophora Alchichica-D10]